MKGIRMNTNHLSGKGRIWSLVFLLVLLGLADPLSAQVRITGGPMPGYSEIREAMIWVQASGPANLSIRYWPKAEKSPVRETPPQALQASEQFIAHVPVTEVEPGTTYSYQVLLDGKAVEELGQLEFHTQVFWPYRMPPPDFTFATGSCAYMNEEPYNRPGTPYGAEYQIFDSIANKRPDFMLWLGDNVYFREGDYTSETGMIKRYEHTRSHPATQKLFRGTHHYAIWDDHDYGPNDSDRSYSRKHLAKKNFDRFWANPPSAMSREEGISTSFIYNDVEFFLLDDRTWRTPGAKKMGKKTMLGQAQLEWLIEGLIFSKASFKVVALGSQFLNPVPYKDTYAENWKAERELILRRIEEEDLYNVIFLTGDRHFSELSLWRSPKGMRVYDLTVSPLTSGVDPVGGRENNPLRLPNTLVLERNFALVSFRGPQKERYCQIQVINAAGQVKWEYTIPFQKAPEK